jgi:hypothetical protein
LAFLSSSFTAAAGDFPLTLVARSGIAPSLRGTDFKLDEMDAPVVGRNGLISFYAPVIYVGFENPLSVNRNAGLFTGTPGNIAWSNMTEHAVASPAATTRRDFKITTNNTNGVSLGRVIYTTTQPGGSTSTEHGLSLGSGANSQLIYKENTPAPSFPSFNLFPFGNTIIDNNLTDSGRVTFSALIGVSGEDTTAGIFTTDSPGSLTKVARTGETPPGATAAFSSLGEPATSDNGTIVFGAALGGSVRNTLWSHSPGGTLQALALPGLATPTPTSGETFRAMYGQFHLAVKADGTTAFAATYGAPGQPDKHGIFIGTPGNLSPLVLDGPAPGTGANFSDTAASLAECIRLNDNGTVVFISNYLTFTPSYITGQGIFARYNGNTVLLAKKGDAAPGTPAGVTFSFFDRNKIALNNSDEIVFYASLSGPGIVSGTNSHGFWSMNLASGVIKLIVRDSDILASGPGTTSTARINYAGSAFDLLRFPSRGGGKSGAFSDTGRFVFKVRYQSSVSQVADGNYALYSAELTSPPPTRLETWRQENFGSTANTGNAANIFVPGPDALPNLIRYALGLASGQNGATDGTAPAVSVEEVGGISYPTLTFIHDPSADDVRLSVAISENADSWAKGSVYTGSQASVPNALTTEISRTPLPGGRERITVRGNQSIGSTPRQFLRLEAEAL